MIVARISPISGKVNQREIDTTQEAIDAYEQGRGLVQEVFPNLSPEDREFIMTGITPEEWESVMGDPE